MLARVLDAVLGTTTKVRILRALVRLDSPVSGTEARRLAGVRSVRAMRASLDELTELGILLHEQTGSVHLYRIRRAHHLVAPLMALFDAESNRISEVRSALRAALESSGLLASVQAIVIFGSNARGEAGPGSDLDLLVVTRDESAASPVRDVLMEAGRGIEERFGPFLSPYVLPEARVRERYQDGDPLMLAIEEEGRALIGMTLRELAEGW